MSISANAVLEVRVGGSATNGGGFVTGASGTDWSQQDAAQYAVTDGVTAGSTTITSATANFGTDVVGNLIYVQGGTGSVAESWYEVKTRSSTTTITVDRSTGLSAGTGVTLNIGGALNSIGQAQRIIALDNSTGPTVYIKYDASPIQVSTASTNVSGGTVSGTNGTSWIGYDTTRTLTNTDTNRPTVQINSSVSNATLFGGGVSYNIRNIILDGNAQTGSKGVNFRGIIFNSRFANFASTAATDQNGGGQAAIYFCDFTGNSAVATSLIACYFCEAYANTATPFTGLLTNCISYGNTGGTTDGFNPRMANNCVAYNNGRDGFRTPQNNTAIVAVNCVAESNAGYGYNLANTGCTFALRNCASYSNTSGRSNGSVVDIDPITGSGSFFTNAGSEDFSPNNTSGAGALLRAASFPSMFPTGTTASYADVGAAQHQDSGGGGGGVTSPTNVFGATGVLVG